MDQYRTDQRLLDSLNDQLEFEKSRYGKKAKGYEKLEHDLALWYFTADKRSAVVESPLDAKYWIVTLDGRLLSFDSYVTKKLGRRIPECIHPAMLIQMLQFWVPRSASFEAAMLNALRFPLLSEDFDVEAEKISMRILRSLAKHENIKDLPTETVTRLLLNDLLRTRLAGQEIADADKELVREALIEENKTNEERLRIYEQRIRSLESLVETERGKHEDAIPDIRQEYERRLSAMQEENIKKSEAIEKNAHEFQAERGQLQETIVRLEKNDQEMRNRVRALEQVAAEAQAHRAATAERMKFLLMALPLVIMPFLLFFLLRSATMSLSVRWIVVIVCVLELVWLHVVRCYGEKLPAIANSKIFILLEKAYKFIFGVLIAGALGSAMWDGVKGAVKWLGLTS